MSVVYPMAAMVALTFGVLLTLFVTRSRTVLRGQVSASYFKVYTGDTEPELSLRLANHFKNLFETPNLFYLACVLSIAQGYQGMVLPVLAWTFVVLRGAHAFIHIGANRLRPRIAVYFASWLVLLSMWGTLAFG